MKNILHFLFCMLLSTALFSQESEMDRRIFGFSYRSNGADSQIVIRVIRNSPADKAGLKKGDFLRKMNGRYVVNLTTNQLSERLAEGDEAILEIERNGKTKSLKMEREPLGYFRQTCILGNCTTGKGTMEYWDGDTYTGQWVHGFHEGRGHYVSANGWEYEGEFVADDFQGQGIYRYADGSYYEGNFEKSQSTGMGKRVYPNGQVYVGEWLNDKRHGQGTLTESDGSNQTGEWAEGEFVGKKTGAATPKPDNPAPKTTQSSAAKTTQPNAGVGLNIEMITVKGGKRELFIKEDEGEEVSAGFVEMPDFLLSKFEITQAQWRTVMGSNPEKIGFPNCDECPVEAVNMTDVQDFLKKINEKTGLDYRLPTEAEWEYAAAGGQKSKKYEYAGSDMEDEVAWIRANGDDRTHPVGQKSPNELGFFDMSGNVSEWTSSLYDHNQSNGQCIRGGSWFDDAVSARVVWREFSVGQNRSRFIGFRVAR